MCTLGVGRGMGRTLVKFALLGSVQLLLTFDLGESGNIRVEIRYVLDQAEMPANLTAVLSRPRNSTLDLIKDN